MKQAQSIDAAVERARELLSRPVGQSDIAAGWDEQHCREWLEALGSIEQYVAGDQSQRGFSIVRSLDSHGSDTMEHARGQALMNLAAALSQAGIKHYA